MTSRVKITRVERRLQEDHDARIRSEVIGFAEVVRRRPARLRRRARQPDHAAAADAQPAETGRLRAVPRPAAGRAAHFPAPGRGGCAGGQPHARGRAGGGAPALRPRRPLQDRARLRAGLPVRRDDPGGGRGQGAGRDQGERRRRPAPARLHRQRCGRRAGPGARGDGPHPRRQPVERLRRRAGGDQGRGGSDPLSDHGRHDVPGPAARSPGCDGRRPPARRRRAC